MTTKMKAVRGMMIGMFMLVPFVMFGQDANMILEQTHSTLLGLSGLIVTIVSLVMGLVGAGMLGVNLWKYFKGDPSSNDALIKVGAGLLIAVIILQVIRVTLIK